MSRPVALALTLILALGAVEALAYGWMHPAPSGPDQPVLCYRPGTRDQRPETRDQRPETRGQRSETRDQRPGTRDQRPGTRDQRPGTRDQRPEARDQRPEARDQRPETRGQPTANSSSSTDNGPQTTDNSSSRTPLPEIYAQAAPMLRCSSGQVFRVNLDAPLTLHLAFFEWDDTDTGSVLEAFRHMPEACLGSVGLILISKEPPILYQIGTETLSFDHTVFRDPGPTGGAAAFGAQVHAFRAVWVADTPAANARQGLAGTSIDCLRTIRIHSALSRFRPAHARVIQGAVRGAATSAAAWQAFKDTMLVDLTLEALPKEGRTPIRPAHGPMIQAQ